MENTAENNTVEFPDSMTLENSDEWLESLDKNGAAVVKGALSPEETQTTIKKFKEFVTMLDSGVDIEDQKTCTNKNWPFKGKGFAGWGAAQSEAAWYLRTRPAVI